MYMVDKTSGGIAQFLYTVLPKTSYNTYTLKVALRTFTRAPSGSSCITLICPGRDFLKF